MKRLILVLSLIATSLLATSSQANSIQEHWKAPTPTKSGQVGIFYDDRELYDNSIGLFGGVARDGSVYSQLCESISDPKCATAVKFAFNANLPPCVAGFSTNCISELYLIDAQGARTNATFKRFASDDPKYSWNGGGSERVPNSRPESIWEVAGTKSEFAVSAIVSGSYRPLKKDLFFDRLSSTISAVKAIERLGRERSQASTSEVTWMDTSSVLSDQDNSYWNGGFGWQSPDDCAAVAKDLCFQRQPMPEDITLGLKIRLAKPVVGWVHGRFKAPTVEINNEGSDQVIDVRGKPIRIPVIGGFFEESSVPPSIWSEFLKHSYGSMGTPDGGSARRIQGFYPLDNLLPLTRLEKYLDLFNDQASATPSVWMFSSVEYRSLEESLRKLGDGSRCVLNNPSVSGIVATNATSYLGAVPEFDKSEGSLNYRVAAPHYDTNRQEFLGTYDLVIDSKVARCIYGLNSSAVKATVEIVATETGSRIVTSVLQERNGWLNLATYGFTYSTPLIKVKLLQEKTESTVSTPTEKTVASPETTKKVASIKCVKGKKTKSFSAVGSAKPSCPKGWKKA